MAQMVKNLPAMRETRVNPWARKIPWRREWVPTPVFLLGEFHELRSLVGYNPWGHKELDATERLTHTHTHTHTRGRGCGEYTTAAVRDWKVCPEEKGSGPFSKAAEWD